MKEKMKRNKLGIIVLLCLAALVALLSFAPVKAQARPATDPVVTYYDRTFYSTTTTGYVSLPANFTEYISVRCLAGDGESVYSYSSTLGKTWWSEYYRNTSGYEYYGTSKYSQVPQYMKFIVQIGGTCSVHITVKAH